jgi:hypothetical protein
MQNLVGVGYFDQTLQEQTISHFGTNITVFSGTVSFEKILALPSIVFDFNCCHEKWPLAGRPSPQHALKAPVTWLEKYE